MPSDWELGIEGHFYIEIYLLEDLYNFISDKIKSGLTEEACIGLKFDQIFTNDYIPFITRPIRFNLVPSQKEVSSLSASDMYPPDSAYGYLSHFRIDEKKQLYNKKVKTEAFILDDSEEQNIVLLDEDDESSKVKRLSSLNRIYKAVEKVKLAIWALVIVLFLLMLKIS